MSTQGLVTLMRGGKVIAKMTAGCNAQKARELADDLASATDESFLPETLLSVMREHEFGCDGCRIVAVSSGKKTMVLDGNDGRFEVDSEDSGYGLWAKTFDIPEFNPRWERGTADHCFLVDLDKNTIKKTSYKGKTLKPEIKVSLKLTLVGKDQWDVETNGLDFHIRKEASEACYAIDVFNSGIEDDDSAYMDTLEPAATLDEALRACLDAAGGNWSAPH